MTPRHRNYMASERCPTCEDAGWVEVGTEPRPRPDGGTWHASIIGPCPNCEHGFRREFGLGARVVGSDLVEYEDPRGGPWGPEGYWRGREIPAGLGASARLGA